jgi:hypothetical protein
LPCIYLFSKWVQLSTNPGIIPLVKSQKINRHRLTQMHTDKLKYKELNYLNYQGLYDVYTELGDGFLKLFYENAITLNSKSNLFNPC